MQWSTVLYSPVQHFIHSAVPGCTVQHSGVQYNTVVSSTTQWCLVQDCPVQHSPVTRVVQSVHYYKSVGWMLLLLVATTFRLFRSFEFGSVGSTWKQEKCIFGTSAPPSFNIQGVPLIKVTDSIDILALKKFEGGPVEIIKSLGLSPRAWRDSV